MIRRFLRGLGDQAFVLEGRCFEREAVPFKMLDAVVDALTGVIVGLPLLIAEQIAPRDLGSLVRLFPVLRRVPRFAELAAQIAVPPDPQEMRRRGFAALRAVLVKLTRMRPVVLFVDDAHWGDSDSAVFLSELAHSDSWHDDDGDGRMVALSLNLSTNGYRGGVLQIRDKQSGEILHEVANTGFGDAIVFRRA